LHAKPVFYNGLLTHSLWIHTMNRCISLVLRPRLGLLALEAALLAGLAAPALAQQQGAGSSATQNPNAFPNQSVRRFPAHTQRGAFVVTAPPNVTVDGKPERLSPGARIWGANRMMVMSATIVGQNLLVNYVREPLGLIHEVWILNEAEAALPLPPKAP
jgi:hypothetical protein